MSHDDESNAEPFRSCGSCQQTWRGLGEFLRDSELRLLGLQASAEWPQANLFVFEHACGSSVSVLTSRLRHLADEPEADPAAWLRGSDECGRHCASLEDRAACDRPCANARDRRVLQIIEQLKQGGPLPAALAGQER